jgi:hypothetical protein
MENGKWKMENGKFYPGRYFMLMPPISTPVKHGSWPGWSETESGAFLGIPHQRN